MLLLTNKKHSPYLKLLAMLMVFIFSFEAAGYSAQDTAYRTNLRVPVSANKRLLSAMEWHIQKDSLPKHKPFDELTTCDIRDFKWFAAPQKADSALKDPYILDPELHETYIKLENNRNRLIAPGLEEFERFQGLYREVEDILRRILMAAGLDPDGYRLYLVDTMLPSARVFKYYPRVFVSLGLLRLCAERDASKDALAYLLAHEVVHIQQGRDDIEKGDRDKKKDKTKEFIRRNLFIDDRAIEYEADLSALGLMDKAGFRPNEASSFVEIMLNWMSEARLEDSSFGSHPELEERLRVLQRIALAYHWESELKDPEPFDNNLQAQAKGLSDDQNRTRLRHFQQRVVLVESADQLMSLLNEANTIGELQLTLLVGYEMLRYKGNTCLPTYSQLENIKKLFEIKLSRFAGNDRAKQTVYRNLQDDLYMMIERDKSWRQNTSGFKFVVMGGQREEDAETLLRIIEMGIPELFLMHFDMILPLRNKQWLKAKDILQHLTNIQPFFPLEPPMQVKRLSHYIDNFLTRVTTELLGKEAQVSIGDARRLLDGLLRLRTQAIIIGQETEIPTQVVYSINEMLYSTVMFILGSQRYASQVSDNDIRNLIKVLEMGETIFMGANKIQYTTSKGAKILHEFSQQANPNARKAILDWLFHGEATELRDSFIESDIKDFAERGFGVLSQGTVFDYLEVLINRYPQALGTFIREITTRVSDAELVQMHQRILATYHKLGWSGDANIFISTLLRMREDDKVFNNDIFDQTLRQAIAKIDPLLVPEIQNFKRELKIFLYIYALGGVLSDMTFIDQIFGREWYGGIRLDGYKVQPGEFSFLVRFFDRIRVDLGHRLAGEGASNGQAEIAFGKYAAVLYLQNLFYAIGHPVRLEDTDLIQDLPGRSSSPWKAFTGDLALVGDMETVNRVEVAFKKRPYQATRLDSKGFTRQDVLGLFAFLDRLPRAYTDARNVLIAQLPPSVFRNLALYLLFIDRVMRQEAGLQIGPQEVFNLDALQTKISMLDSDKKKRIFAVLQDLIAELIEDKLIDRTNQAVIAEFARGRTGVATMDNPLSYTGRDGSILAVVSFRGLQPPDEATMLSQHAKEEKKYENVLYATLGGSLAQIKIFTARLADERLMSLVSSQINLKQKRGTIETYYPEPSPARDRWLQASLEAIRNFEGQFDEVEIMLGMFVDHGLRDHISLDIFENFRTLNPPEIFKRANGVTKDQAFEHIKEALGYVTSFFPDPSPLRNDILIQTAHDMTSNPEEYAEIEKLLMDPFKKPETLRTEEGANVAFGLDMFRSLIKGRTPQEKSELLLWLLGFSNRKPVSLVDIEYHFHVSFDVFRNLMYHRTSLFYPEAGISEQRELLSPFFYGKGNVFENAQYRQEFLDNLFNSLVPSLAPNKELLKIVYDAVFTYADAVRREGIILNLTRVLTQKRMDIQADLNPEVMEAKIIGIFLESLGPIGVKIGQVLSSSARVPKKMRMELRHLQSQARVLNKAVIYDFVKKFYGKFNSKFKSIGKPLGQGSNRVVYEAELSNGRKVAAKLKRPEAEKRSKKDVEFFRNVLAAVRPKLQAHGIILPKSILARVEAIYLGELNYDQDFESQRTIRNNLIQAVTHSKSGRKLWQRAVNKIFFKILDRVFPSPKHSYEFGVPEPIEVKGNALFLDELIEGSVLLSDEEGLRSAGFDPQDLRLAAAREFFRQLLIDGVYHADPHMGNVLVKITGDGRLYLIDFGAVCSISYENRWKLVRLIWALSRNDTKSLVKIASSFKSVINTQFKNDLKTNVLESREALPARLLWFFQILEDANAEIPEELLSVFRFLCAGGELFEFNELSSDEMQSGADISTSEQMGGGVGIPVAVTLALADIKRGTPVEVVALMLRDRLIKDQAAGHDWDIDAAIEFLRNSSGAGLGANRNTIDRLIQKLKEMKQGIDVLDIRMRTRNELRYNGIRTIDQLLRLNEKHLKSLREMGDARAEETIGGLRKLGLSLKPVGDKSFEIQKSEFPTWVEAGLLINGALTYSQLREFLGRKREGFWRGRKYLAKYSAKMNERAASLRSTIIKKLSEKKALEENYAFDTFFSLLFSSTGVTAFCCSKSQLLELIDLVGEVRFRISENRCPGEAWNIFMEAFGGLHHKGNSVVDMGAIIPSLRELMSENGHRICSELYEAAVRLWDKYDPQDQGTNDLKLNKEMLDYYSQAIKDFRFYEAHPNLLIREFTVYRVTGYIKDKIKTLQARRNRIINELAENRLERKQERAYEPVIRIMKNMVKTYQKALGMRGLAIRNRVVSETGMGSVRGGMGLSLRLEQKLSLRLAQLARIDFDNLITIDKELAWKYGEKFICMLNFVMPHEYAHILLWDLDLIMREDEAKRTGVVINKRHYKVKVPAFDAEKLDGFCEANIINNIAAEVVIDKTAFELATKIYMHDKNLPGGLNKSERYVLAIGELVLILLENIPQDADVDYLILHMARFRAELQSLTQNSEIQESIKLTMADLIKRIEDVVRLLVGGHYEAYAQYVDEYQKLFDNTKITLDLIINTQAGTSSKGNMREKLGSKQLGTGI